MKEKLKNIKFNKKMVIIPAAILIVVLIIVLILVLTTKGESQEVKLTNELKELGTDFYENFYYKQIGSNDEERSKFLEKYKDIGIKVNLDNLSRYNGKDSKIVLEKFVNNKTDKECDKNLTQVIIYPQEPYNQESYEIEVQLECGFKE